MNAYFDSMRRYFSLTGRLSRSGYWEFMLGATLLALVGVFIDYALGHQLFALGRLGLVALLIIAAHFLPLVAASVRRIHDSGQSGWLYWLIYIPVLGWIPFLGLMLAKGSEGPNQYGEPWLPDAGKTLIEFGSYRQVPPNFERVVEKPIDARATNATVPNTAFRPVAAPPTAATSVIDQLERLAALKAAGGLTDEEFGALKADLMSKVVR